MSAEGRVQRSEVRDRRAHHSAFCTLHSALICLLLAIPAQASEWLSLDTPHFQIFTNAGPQAAKATADTLEHMRAALAVGSHLKLESETPIRVYFFKTNKDYLRYGTTIAGGMPGKDGLSIVHPNAKAILVDGSAARPYELLQHELAHQYVRQTYGLLPLWLDEGLAEVYAGTRIRHGIAQVGRTRELHRRVIRRYGIAPLRELLMADKKSRWYLDPLLESRYYASTWLLAHWLMRKRPGDIEALRAELARGSVDDAVAKVFGMTYPQLQRTLLRYNSLPSLPSDDVRLGAITVDLPEPRTLNASEEESLFAWTAPVTLVVRQMVVEHHDRTFVEGYDRTHVERYDEAVKKVARGELAAAIEALDALIPQLPKGALLDDAKKLRAEVEEIVRKNRGGK